MVGESGSWLGGLPPRTVAGDALGFQAVGVQGGGVVQLDGVHLLAGPAPRAAAGGSGVQLGQDLHRGLALLTID